jgi:hypothetical protein
MLGCGSSGNAFFMANVWRAIPRSREQAGAIAMKVLLIGACGFVGRTIAAELHKQSSGIEISGIQ